MTSQPDQYPSHEQTFQKVPLTWGNFGRLPVLAIIRLYQKTFSRLIPVDTCRFQPTCSHYGYQAIAKYGVIKGGWIAARRILRCNPFHPGGNDPVP